jgi:hypothetical protein
MTEKKEKKKKLVATFSHDLGLGHMLMEIARPTKEGNFWELSIDDF